MSVTYPPKGLVLFCFCTLYQNIGSKNIFKNSYLGESLSHDGFSVCRVSVGSSNFCADDAVAYLHKITDAEKTFTRLHKALHSSKTRGRGLIFVDLIRICFRSRFSWALRTLTPTLAGRVALAADDALTRLLTLALPRHQNPTLPDEWLHLNHIHNIKLALPLARGGLGLRPW